MSVSLPIGVGTLPATRQKKAGSHGIGIPCSFLVVVPASATSIVTTASRRMMNPFGGCTETTCTESGLRRMIWTQSQTALPRARYCVTQATQNPRTSPAMITSIPRSKLSCWIRTPPPMRPTAAIMSPRIVPIGRNSRAAPFRCG